MKITFNSRLFGYLKIDKKLVLKKMQCWFYFIRLQFKKRTKTEPLGRLSWEGQKSALRRPKQATFPLNIDTGFIAIAAGTSHNASLGNLYSMVCDWSQICFWCFILFQQLNLLKNNHFLLRQQIPVCYFDQFFHNLKSFSVALLFVICTSICL